MSADTSIEGPPGNEAPPVVSRGQRRNRNGLDATLDSRTRLVKRIEALHRRFWRGHPEAKAAITRILEGSLC